MATLLQINASARSSGNANLLADRFVVEWQAAHQAGVVVKRDVGAEPLPHLNEEILGAFFTPASARSPEQAVLAARSDDLIAERTDRDGMHIQPMQEMTDRCTVQDRTGRFLLDPQRGEEGVE